MAQGPRTAWLAPSCLPLQGGGQHPGWSGHGAGRQEAGLPEGPSLVRVLQQQVHETNTARSVKPVATLAFPEMILHPTLTLDVQLQVI